VERNAIIYSCCPEPYIQINYYIIIKRRPLFYVFNMILPSILITIVGFLGFVIPPDCGEKV
jgi:nicotinic acetylcholine receptor